MSILIALTTIIVFSCSQKALGQQWSSSGNNISNSNSGNVGVGTTSPAYSLDVNGGLNGFRAKAATTSSSDTISTFENASGIKVIVRGNGNVGIGTTNPAYSLDIIGGANNSFRAKAATSSSNDVIGVFENTNGIQAIVRGNGFFGIGTTTPAYSLDIFGVNAFRAKSSTSSSSDVISAFENPNGIQAIVRGNGNVGIGTITPAAKLEVVGNINVSGTGNITASGTIEGGNVKAKYQDVAEWVPAVHTLPPGTVVALDPSKSNHVTASSQAYDTRVAGVVSAQPGITLGEQAENKVLVATTGRVRIKVIATDPIQVGDLLVTSDIPGVAMKSQPLNVGGVQLHRPGTLIGKALEPLAKGSGEILVLLSLQ